MERNIIQGKRRRSLSLLKTTRDIIAKKYNIPKTRLTYVLNWSSLNGKWGEAIREARDLDRNIRKSLCEMYGDDEGL